MRNNPKRMISQENAREIEAIIEKRLAQGLSKAVIAKRLGISAGIVFDYAARVKRERGSTQGVKA